MLAKYSRTLLLGSCAAAVIAMTQPAAAQPMARVEFDIDSQPLAAALTQFAQQSKLEILFSSELARDRRAPAVRGDMEPGQALSMLLAQSGLSYRATPGGSFVVEATSDPQSGSAAGDGAEVEALIVTAQKREEDIQDVPIAISAFTQESLEAQKIEGGFDLLKAIPNVTFSKNNFTGYNFSIRGIGTKAVSATTDPAVAVAFNSTPLIRNRLFEQEYFDVERVEVLRGPQGTLYGRNATSGVINVISAKPRMGEFEGMAKVEVGNYSARRASGVVNVPLTEDTMALRIAGAWTQRDGYGVNLFTGKPADGRDLWSARGTLGLRPSDSVRVNLIWEHFEEDDNRQRTGKQLCHRDEGPESVGAVNMLTRNKVERAFLSQGCVPGSLHEDAAFGVPNGLAIPFILYPVALNFHGGIFKQGYASEEPEGDPYEGVVQSQDLRAFTSEIESVYRAKADVIEFNADFDITPELTFTWQTAYNRDQIYATQDFNRFNTRKGIFVENNPTLLPDGYFDDPQLGRSNAVVGKDLSRATSSQFSQEIRLQSSFDGPFNFNVGANYLRYKTLEDYFVFFNILNILAYTNIGLGALNLPGAQTCKDDPFAIVCISIDDSPFESITGQGRNYFRSQNPYKVQSAAAFGEAYYQVSDALKLTAGLRYTNDKKRFTPIPSETLLTDPTNCLAMDPNCLTYPGLGLIFGQPGEGYPALPDIKQRWGELTGRLAVDYQPELSFTDKTMLYASYSRGYKGGGANPPGIGLQPPPAGTTFRPEFVNAFEVGAKNTLLQGSVLFNASAFYYDYKDYQISKIVDRSAANENFDAKVWGLEFETLWHPTQNLRFNANLGYLDTKLGEGSKSIDLMNRTGGNPDWMIVKPFVTATSNCIVRREDVEKLLAMDSAYALSAFCPGGGFAGDYASNNAFFGTTHDPNTPGINGGHGFDTDVSGNELPNSPHWTFNAGAQYKLQAPGGWEAVLRSDVYWQSQSFARVYNTQYDKLRAWKNVNVSLLLIQEDYGIAVEAYVKNVFDDIPITDAFLNSDDTALTTNIFVLDPRLIGLSVRKQF